MVILLFEILQKYEFNMIPPLTDFSHNKSIEFFAEPVKWRGSLIQIFCSFSQLDLIKYDRQRGTLIKMKTNVRMDGQCLHSVMITDLRKKK